MPTLCPPTLRTMTIATHFDNSRLIQPVCACLARKVCSTPSTFRSCPQVRLRAVEQESLPAIQPCSFCVYHSSPSERSSASSGKRKFQRIYSRENHNARPHNEDCRNRDQDTNTRKGELNGWAKIAAFTLVWSAVGLEHGLDLSPLKKNWYWKDG